MLFIGCAHQPAKNYRYKGLYYWGHEVNTFQPCGKRIEYWVSANFELQSRLQRFSESETSEPYQPVYVEIDGHLLNEPLVGFAEGYSGLLRVAKVVNQTAEVPKACLWP